jgi:hypothetical protein
MAKSNVGSPACGCKNKTKKVEEEVQDPKKHFINFKVLDQNKKPIENVILHVILPDGSCVEKTTDKNGIVEIKNVEPGTCSLKSDWKKVSVYNAVLIQ